MTNFSTRVDGIITSLHNRHGGKEAHGQDDGPDSPAHGKGGRETGGTTGPERGDGPNGNNGPGRGNGPDGNNGYENANNRYGNNGNGPKTGGSYTPDNPNATTGGPAPRGLLDVAPEIVYQLGRSVFQMASSPQGVLREGYGNPSAQAAPGQQAPAHSAGNSMGAAFAAGAARFAEPGLVASNALQGSQVATAAGRGAAPGNAAPATATSTPLPASMTAPQATAPQQRTVADASLVAQSRPGDAAMAARADAAQLAAARAAAMTPAMAPTAPNAAPPTLANAAVLPSGNPQALAVAGLTVATVPVMQAVDARGVILPTHDAANAQRADNVMNPAGHTLDGAQRRGLRSRLSSMPQGGMARLLWAMGALGHTAEDERAGAERDARRAMQWVFWILAVVAYGCLGAAIIVFVGSDGRLADSVADRTSTTWLAMCGLAAGVIAWGVARWMSRRR